MNWVLIRAIAINDLKLAIRNKSVTVPMYITAFVFLIVVPLGVTGTMSSVRYADPERALELMGNFPASALQSLPAVDPAGQLIYLVLVHLMTPFFMTLPVMLAGVLAADSFAGERERKTLEYLLNSPATDRELVVAKMLAAWLPALTFAGIGVIPYLIAANLVLHPILGGIPLPDASWAILLLGVIPAASALTLGISVLISSKVDSFQAAYQAGPLVTFPFMGLMVTQLTGAVFLDSKTMMGLTLALWILAAITVTVSVRSFRRAELLGKASKAVTLEAAVNSSR